MNEEKSPRDSFMIAFGIYGAIGFQFVICVAGMAYLGLWLDRKWGTDPWLLIAGVLLGSVTGFYNLYRLVTFRQKQ